MPHKTPAKPKGVTRDKWHVTGKAKPLYRRPAPKPRSAEHRSARNESAHTRSNAPRSDDIPHAHPIAPSHFTLREDGSVAPVAAVYDRRNEPEERRSQSAATNEPPRLAFHDAGHRLWLYHGNCLELLDAIAAKYPDGRFDAIFADPPYFLSNGGITCHAGKMVKVDKGDWDVSRGPELNHEFNTEWLRRCQRVLKPNGTIWVTGTHHVIFSIGYAMQQLGYKILNDIAWEKPNPPPNLSCRYFTHSTETVLWAAKDAKSKHVFNYQEMRKVTGKQMKTVWRKNEFEPRMDTDKHGLKQVEKEFEGRAELLLRQAAQQRGPTEEKEIRVHPWLKMFLPFGLWVRRDGTKRNTASIQRKSPWRWSNAACWPRRTKVTWCWTRFWAMAQRQWLPCAANAAASGSNSICTTLKSRQSAWTVKSLKSGSATSASELTFPFSVGRGYRRAALTVC